MDVATGLVRVVQADAVAASPAEVAAALSDVADLRSWLTAVELSLIGRLPGSDAAGAGPVEVVAVATRCGTREAARAVEQADTLALVPGFTQALREGRTTPAHLSTLSGVVRRLPSEDRSQVSGCARRLVDAACSSTPERFARVARAVVSGLRGDTPAVRRRRQRASSFLRCWTDPVSGMRVIHGELDPVTGLRFAGALERVIEDRYRGRVRDEVLDHDLSRDHLRARALVALVRTGHRRGHPRQCVADTASTSDPVPTPGLAPTPPPSPSRAAAVHGTDGRRGADTPDIHRPAPRTSGTSGGTVMSACHAATAFAVHPARAP